MKVIGKEYREAFEKLKKQYNSLLGKLNYQKGYFAEYLILEKGIACSEDERWLESGKLKPPVV